MFESRAGFRVLLKCFQEEKLGNSGVNADREYSRFGSRDFDRRGFDARPLEAAFERTFRLVLLPNSGSVPSGAGLEAISGRVLVIWPPMKSGGAARRE